MEMKEQIREYLLANSANRAKSVRDDESLLLSGVIDSMTMIEFVTYLEKTFGITIDEDEMVPENFETIESIVTYVSAKRTNQ